MILLTSTSDLVQIVTSGTQAVNVHASWIDTSSGTQTPGRTNTLISSAATTPVVASPASSTQRNLKTLVISNTDASASDTVTVQHTDGTNVVRLLSLTLPAGYTLTWTDEAGWILSDASGGRVETPLAGRFLKSTPLTSGTTFTTGPSTSASQISVAAAGGTVGGLTMAVRSPSGTCWFVWRSNSATWYGAEAARSSCGAPALTTAPAGGGTGAGAIGWQSGGFPAP